jgi:hypothetical protein
MSRSSAINPLRTNAENVVEYKSLWSSPGSAGDLVKDFGKSFSTCNRSGAGEYTVTLYGDPGELVGACVVAHGDAGTAPLKGQVIFSTVAKTASTTTVDIEFYENDAGVDTLADPLSAAHPKVEVCLHFKRSGS